MFGMQAAQVDPIEALRSRVAVLGEEQRAALRRELERRGIDWSRVAPPEETHRPSRLPLTPAQLHFWVQQQLKPESTAYLIAFSWRLRGTLDRDALQRSLQHIVDRHEPLRTSFAVTDGETWQNIQEKCDLPLGFTDLAAAPERLAKEVQGAAASAFNLARAPLLRAHLFRLAERDHTLVICMHHIVADGWSRGIFMRELAACYRAFSAGRDPELPPLQRSYGDFVLKQHEWLAGAGYEAQKRFWRDKLSGLDALELPTDRPRGSAHALSVTSGTALRTLPADLSQRVSALAGQLSATPFMVLLAAFKLLLHRYSGQSDLAVAVPVAGREDAASDVVGLFTNTLLLRTALDPALSFRGWLDRVRSTLADAFEHQEFPFPRVAEALDLGREASQNPLFQIMFQAQTAGYRQQNARTVDLGVADLEVTQEVLPLAETKFDLGWHIMEREDGLAVMVEYRTGLFDAARIERMIEHFEQLLRSVAGSPDGLLPTLDYMQPHERDALNLRGLGKNRPLPPLGVHQAISEIASGHADRTALVCEGRAWSYAELEQAAEALARHLLSVPGLERPGVRIAVSMPGKAYSVIAFLAILKMGAIYVPVDPKNPADRIAYILEDAEATVVLTRDPSFFPSHRCVDPTAFSDELPECALPASDPRRIAYILYTSGSTGRPKGVPIDHVGLLNQLCSLAREPGIAPGDRMLALTTPAFDISILEMLWPLSVGATVVMYDQDLLLAPRRLTDILDEHGITHLQATPASWRMLLDSGWVGRPGLIGLCGGEALDAQLAGRLVERIGSLWNVYGPTETTIWASALRVLPRHIEGGKVPIGGLLDNTQFHIFDGYLQPVPDGNPGELLIGGVGLSPGYWRRPALAAEKFVPNPSATTIAGERLYRTGDLVVRRPSGELEFIGRTDFQIKLRGYRIEIGEIESLLHEQAGVEQAIVVLDKPNERLVAYCLVDGSAASSDKGAMRRELRRALAAKLPRYMVPAAFVLMDAFPLNPNGKVDRRKLPAPETPTSLKTPLAPRNDTEEILLGVWKQVLGRDDIGVEDNLFDLGGDSIGAIRIAAGARGRGLVLAPGQLFEHQTVAAQALIAEPPKRGTALEVSLWQRWRAGAADEPWVVSFPLAAGGTRVAEALAFVARHHACLDGRFGGLKVLAKRLSGDAMLQWANEGFDADHSWHALLMGAEGDAELALAVPPLLLDRQSLPRLAADVREVVARLSAGADPALQAMGDYRAWLEGGEPTPRSSTAADTGAAQAAAMADGGALIFDDADTRRLLDAARDLETSAELVILTAVAHAVLEANGAEQAEVDLLTSSRFGLGNGLRLAVGNFTRLVPLSVSASNGDVAARLAATAAMLSAQGGQGVDPAAPTRSDLAVAVSSTDGSNLAWHSTPATAFPPGYALAAHAHVADDAIRIEWCHDPARFASAAVQQVSRACEAFLRSVEPRGKSATARLDRLLSTLKQRQA
ncbi:non-ribosomal peptide synthetase [Aquamicrobium sp. LC103]|uniref:non-ribosomal peptide synthetase n=1 Tax=Aquamicrobium sp. LC103 TaxID=1120658 RepID=UPI00069A2428|nr:non-ribosomal peptide synthetase [Aquamicrobium sp. LC103]TKT78148.1 non-ribosomal peptide synthetase [Aquamicrobium sp. LC103]